MTGDRRSDEIIDEPAHFDVPASVEYMLKNMTTLSLEEYRNFGNEVVYRAAIGEPANGFTGQKVGESLNVLVEMARLGHIARTGGGMSAISEAEQKKFGNGNGILFVLEPDQAGFSWSPLLKLNKRSKRQSPINHLVVESLEDMVQEAKHIISATEFTGSPETLRKRRLANIRAALGRAVTPSSVKIWAGVVQLAKGGTNKVENLDI